MAEIPRDDSQEKPGSDAGLLHRALLEEQLRLRGEIDELK